MATSKELMTIGKIAVDHCASGREADLMEKYYARDAVSVEAVPMPGGSAESIGLEAIRAKGEWWMNAHEIHDSKVDGPFVHGDDRFCLIFDIDVTHKESGQRTQMREIGTYFVKDGKIIREEFAYPVTDEG